MLVVRVVLENPPVKVPHSPPAPEALLFHPKDCVADGCGVLAAPFPLIRALGQLAGHWTGTSPVPVKSPVPNLPLALGLCGQFLLLPGGSLSILCFPAQIKSPSPFLSFKGPHKLTCK